MAKGVKRPSPLKTDMGFDEALERFIGTKPSEVDALIERGKTEKAAGHQACTQGVRRDLSIQVRSGFTPQADAEAGHWSLAVYKANDANARGHAQFCPRM